MKKSERLNELFKVYLLPKENYVGCTPRLNARIAEHKYLGRNVDGAKVLYEFDNLEDALNKELELHDSGYLGGRRRLNGSLVVCEHSGVFFNSIKEAWESYGEGIGYRYFLEMMDGRKKNKTNYTLIQ